MDLWGRPGTGGLPPLVWPTASDMQAMPASLAIPAQKQRSQAANKHAVTVGQIEEPREAANIPPQFRRLEGGRLQRFKNSADGMEMAIRFALSGMGTRLCSHSSAFPFPAVLRPRQWRRFNLKRAGAQEPMNAADTCAWVKTRTVSPMSDMVGQLNQPQGTCPVIPANSVAGFWQGTPIDGLL